MSARVEYQPYVRRGTRHTPQWRLYEVGHVFYNISDDTFSIVMRKHERLTLLNSEPEDSDDYGASPKELGYVQPPDFDGEPYLCLIPSWMANAGISASEIGALVLSRRCVPR